MRDTSLVEVKKNKNESSASLIRRFSKQARSHGVVRKMRERRYFARDKSKNVMKQKRLNSLEKQKKFELDLKLGKIELPSFTRK